jgi:hypothetical protein
MNNRELSKFLREEREKINKELERINRALYVYGD